MAHYRREVVENETKYKQVQADPTKDEYDAKRFRDIWEESVRMVPDAERRFQAAKEDLASHVQTHFADETAEENEWLPVARELLLEMKESSKDAGVDGEVTNVDDLIEGEAF